MSISPESVLHDLAISAWQYEHGEDTLYTDAEFDSISYDLTKQEFKDPVIREFMKEHFHPSTGMWVYNYPYLDKVKEWTGI